MTKFYELIPCYNPDPMMTPLVHGWSIKYKEYISSLNPEEPEDAVFHSEFDPDLEPMDLNDFILYRTGPFVPAITMPMGSWPFLACQDSMKHKIEQKFPFISFNQLPIGRIVNLLWQDWEPGDNPEVYDEPENYILCGVHDEKLAAEMGIFYRLSFQVGANVKLIEILPQYLNMLPKSDDIFQSSYYKAIDPSSWNGNDFFYGGMYDNPFMRNRTIFVSENGKQWMEDNQLIDFYSFEELLDLNQWQQYAKG